MIICSTTTTRLPSDAGMSERCRRETRTNPCSSDSSLTRTWDDEAVGSKDYFGESPLWTLVFLNCCCSCLSCGWVATC